MENLTKKIPLLTKLILILLGIFVTSLTFATTIKFLQETGIWLGLIISMIIILTGFYYTSPGNKLRIILWSIAGTIITFFALFIVWLEIINKALK
ncbi:MAG: hypothetical protein AAB540_00830 [Patescibacteria group bacterium]